MEELNKQVAALKSDEEQGEDDWYQYFIRAQEGHSRLPPEQEDLWNKLDGFGKQHIEQIVENQMRIHNVPAKKWGWRLSGFVQKAVDSVKPSSRILNDSMNFNQFIKIKIIKARDEERSSYINGVVMSKDLADKRMTDVIQKPTILLLKDSLMYQQVEIENAYEQHDLDIVRQQLIQLNPSIVIVQKDVPTKLINLLREEQISLITNMSIHKMKRIARYTQTLIAPSLNVIDKNFILGKCQHFRIEKVANVS